MNNRNLEKKVRQDAAKVKKNIGTLVEDSAVQFGKLENNVSQATGKAKEDLTTWVDDNASHLGKGLNKLVGDARETVVDTTAAVKKDIGHGVNQFNVKAQKALGNEPDTFSKMVTRYPWAAVAIGLAVGFLLGNFLKPTRQPLG